MSSYENSANPDQLDDTMKTERKDWQKSFYTVIPPRKGAVLKVKEGSNGQTKEKGDSPDIDKITDSASKLKDDSDMKPR